MLRVIRIFLASVVVFLAGCAVSPEMHVSNMLEKTDASMAAGDLAAAHGYIASAFDTPGQGAQITKFFAEKPARRDIYVKIMAYHIANQLAAPAQASIALVHINRAEAQLYITPQDAQALREQLVARAQQGNLSNTIAFMLRDSLEGLGLDSNTHKEIVLKRSLAAAKGVMDAASRQTAALMAYAADPNTPAAHKKLIEKSLNEMVITRQEMVQYVQPVFPKYAQAQMANMTLNAAFVYVGGDKLAREDLLGVVRGKINGVEWQPEGSKAATIVRVERLRQNEHTEPPRTETVRYTRSQVTAYQASKLPKDITYAYKLTKNAVSIEYGYEIKVIVNGQVTHSQIVRGTERSESTHCSDAVVRNAVGGVWPVNYEANYDMRKRCGASGSASIHDLRRAIDEKVADSILSAPAIARINYLNS